MILNFGSINIDNVYRVNRFPKAGETISSQSYEKILGGKGINQSVAIHQANGKVKHIGYIGDDEWILSQISKMEMKTDFISKCYGPTGHAIIFVDNSGENEIIIHAGANNQFSKSQCFEILKNFASKDSWIVLQNEINLSIEIATKAKELGFKVCYSAAPFNAKHAQQILPYVDLLAMNETDLSIAADEKIKTFQADAARDAGIFHHLITLPTYHTAALSTDNLAKEYFGSEGMLGYVSGVQRKEIRQGIACVKHQNMSGSDLGDDHKEYFAGEAALKAAGEDNTMNQFN
ncbi:PfkB family carbohydrate kinase [Amylibacter sp.]|nr:PfkB family carbohydrate kinase [Amylibacter sp.]